MSNNNKPTVLVVGASGLVGTAAAHAFLDAGWRVIASSRRRPELLEGREYEFLPLDLQDRDACGDAASRLREVSHVVYTAVYELPGLIEGWSDPGQIATNGRMLKNLMEPLAEAADLQHVTILQGTKAYGATVRPMRVPARESQPRVEHPNFYWVQEDYIRDKAESIGCSYTILRPQLIVGPNHGVVMNLPPIVGAYAAMRREEGASFSFPGSVDWVWEAVDVRLVGNACVWAAGEPRAAGETYNLTNGEVFLWRDMWPAMAATLGAEAGADEPMSLAEYFSTRAPLWDDIVRKYDLQPIALDALLGESHYYADLCFAFGAEQSPAPTYVSTVKIKQAGFGETHNSEESFCYWLRDLQRRRVIPTY
ncbi:MAG: NAD-dependent epimerase/dehydratase family protein [Gammaproteobacteria bacterium]|nr:NAD-dependent epimerase/dehydratase family protein [Gammaproteobacteria bacterium]